MKKAWEAWVESNQTVNALCLMNNPGKVNEIKDLLRKNITDPKTITDKVMNEQKREYSYDEIGEIVKKIMADNPNITNELPDELKTYVCAMRDGGTPPDQIVKDFSTLTQGMIGRDLTVKEIENLDCEGK